MRSSEWKKKNEAHVVYFILGLLKLKVSGIEKQYNFRKIPKESPYDKEKDTSFLSLGVLK